MTTVYFVRHAKPNYNNHNDMLRELSSKGMEDRRLVTEFLADKHIDVVLSSPFPNMINTCWQSAFSFNLHTEKTLLRSIYHSGRSSGWFI